MYLLILFKNLDPNQKVPFSSVKSSVVVQKKLREWMTANNGEFDKRRGMKPCLVDGLTTGLSPQSFQLVWCEYRKKWVIEWTDGLGDVTEEEEFDCWDNVVTEFVKNAWYHIECLEGGHGK